MTAFTLPIPVRPRWPLIALASLLAAGGGWYAVAQLAPGDRGVPPIDSSSNYEVTGVQVDVAGKTADEARTAAWRIAQRKGWKILWGRMHGLGPDAAPGLPDSTLDSIIAGIEVESEQVGPHRYIATLGLLFDRARTGEMIGSGTSTPHSAPMLVIPIQYGGAGPQTFEARTSWQKAWARFRTGSSPIDYVRPVGNGPDPLLLNLGQARRPGRLWWRSLLDQYGASDIVVPEVYLERRYPGGPIAARFVARHGPDGQILGSFGLVATSPDGLDKMLDQGVKRIDELYVQALNGGDLHPDPSLTIEEPDAPADDLLPTTTDDPLASVISGIDQGSQSSATIQVETADVAALDQAQSALRAVPGVQSASVQSLALGGTSLLSLSYDGALGPLKLGLQARGWRLEGEGASLVMRRAGPAPAPSPAPPPGQPKP
ncbi:heavy-metal-associated domain-containing protein [Sphingomonas abietis]|uniref:Heavy-metal-associated domain-containing protein n=1 Tax=Sphingomonas abietis TaxID=3012344 RepID=A0ABY7NRI4_9SPHN|nr:heavy-metal-associated domain-containing protein [Sphingomonas abietis]WBO24154.1 heavy-metal-associated domain-containing protein [Sphingomonas abietis]